MLTDKEIENFLQRVSLARIFSETGLSRTVTTKMRQGNFETVRERSRQIVSDYYDNILK